MCEGERNPERVPVEPPLFTFVQQAEQFRASGVMYLAG